MLLGILFHDVLKELLFIWKMYSIVCFVLYLIGNIQILDCDRPTVSREFNNEAKFKSEMIGENHSIDIERNSNFSVKCFTENQP